MRVFAVRSEFGNEVVITVWIMNLKVTSLRSSEFRPTVRLLATRPASETTIPGRPNSGEMPAPRGGQCPAKMQSAFRKSWSKAAEVKCPVSC